MSARLPRRVATLAVAVLAAAALSAVAAGTAGAEVVYNNVPGTLPGNFASIGLAATSSTAFGGEVELAGTARKHPTITVVMSSWTCESGAAEGVPSCITKHPNKKFKVPVTIRVYGAGELNQAPYAEKTQNIGMSYRPSEDKVHCTGGRWYDAATTECSHGYAFPIKLKLTKLQKMPTKAVITVSYPTTSVPAQSLNVSVSEPPEHTLSVGTDPSSEWVVDSSWSGMYGPGATDVGTLRFEQGLGGVEGEGIEYQPVFKVEA